MRNAETLNADAVAFTRRSTLPPGRMLVREANPSMEVPCGETVCQSAVGVSFGPAGASGDAPADVFEAVAAAGPPGLPGRPSWRTRTKVSTAARTRTAANTDRTTDAEGPRRRTTDTPTFC